MLGPHLNNFHVPIACTRQQRRAAVCCLAIHQRSRTQQLPHHAAVAVLCCNDQGADAALVGARVGVGARGQQRGNCLLGNKVEKVWVRQSLVGVGARGLSVATVSRR